MLTLCVTNIKFNKYIMKRYVGLISLLLFGLHAAAAGFSTKSEKGFLYKSFDAPSVKGDVFIFSRDMSDVAIDFSVEDSTGFKWFEYELDLENAVRLTENVDYEIAENGKSSTLKSVKSNHGYYVEYGEEGCEEADTCARAYMWIAAYAPIEAVTWDKEALICSGLELQIEPSMKFILNKASDVIERELNIVYSTFKEEDRQPGIYEISDDQSVSITLNVEPIPYVNTDFVITDNFGKKLNPDSAVFVTDTFYTLAVIAFPTMSVRNKELNELDPDNNWETDESGNVIVYFSETINLGSAAEFRTSAPLSIDFVSNASPMVNMYEWHISREETFTSDRVYFTKDINGYVFTEPGIHYIKLVVANNINPPDEFCDHTAYAVFNISESEILVPNVFTPNGDGANDEFKVAYRSIASYRCRVYNQWGKKVYDSTDITSGWDGTIGGRAASVGAYFYIIDAKGTDGRVIKKRGDINLLRSK